MNRRFFVQSSVAAAVACALPWSRLHAFEQAAAAGIPAVKLNGSATVIDPAALKDLKARLRGPLLLAGDPGYDEARRILNPSFDKRPAFVCQPTGAADVRNVVNFARERELLVAVKCGGHSFGGKSTCDGGVQVDLSRMRGVRVDPAKRVAHVEGGSLLGDVDHETIAHGLVTTTGTVSHTGVGGLTLGGGFGRLARRFGLAIDNLRSVDVVTADGKLVHASENENPDLFWALRGGGGNFGIVTNFEFGLQPMERQVVAGTVVFPIARAKELLAFYGEYSAAAPDELYLDAIMSAPPGGQPGVFLLNPVWSGPAAEAERVLAPIRKLGKPLQDTVRQVDYVALQRAFDNTDPRSEGIYLKSGFLDAYPASLPAAIADRFQPDPGRNTLLFFQHCGGAIGRVAMDATAFPHRRATHNMLTNVAWKLETDGAPHIRYLKDYWSGLEPFTNGWYTNESDDEAQEIRDANYQGNLPRLRQLKRKYDPMNLFRLNANVLPA
jgi:FAD/FMN-containing dehydrogenase